MSVVLPCHLTATIAVRYIIKQTIAVVEYEDVLKKEGVFFKISKFSSLEVICLNQFSQFPPRTPE